MFELQNYSEAERRKVQLELKETKMDMFKIEKVQLEP